LRTTGRRCQRAAVFVRHVMRPPMASAAIIVHHGNPDVPFGGGGTQDARPRAPTTAVQPISGREARPAPPSNRRRTCHCADPNASDARLPHPRLDQSP
jgi:hypothetical protein